jgi:hypothetical protein
MRGVGMEKNEIRKLVADTIDEELSAAGISRDVLGKNDIDISMVDEKLKIKVSDFEMSLKSPSQSAVDETFKVVIPFVVGAIVGIGAFMAGKKNS